MGFHVEFDDNSKELLRLVQEDTSKIFGQLYSASLLFLLGERDEDALNWLLANAKVLDSLTGKSIAFAVFAKKFTLRLRTSSGDRRTPMNVGEMNAADLKGANVRRLVMEGVFGDDDIADEDEITAITYGTDIIAKDLGLLSQLPCLVVFDAVPTDKPYVLNLNRALIEVLLPLLRKAVAEFIRDDGDVAIRSDARCLIALQNEIEMEKRSALTCQEEIARAQATIEKIQTKIDSGRATASVEYLEEIIHKRRADLARCQEQLERLPHEQPQRLRVLEAKLDTALARHRDHRALLFSNILRREARARGLRSTVGNAKGSMLSFAASLLKPDMLLKIWAAA